jgi:hypothetical protein
VTKIVRWVKKQLVHSIRRSGLFFLGDLAPRFSGMINDKPGHALANSGSSVLVLDEDYARSLQLQVLDEDQYHTQLEFADGSRAYTSGITKGVRWRFGQNENEEEHLLDFHILKNAPARIILSNSFLYGTEAYSRHHCYLVDDDEESNDCNEEIYFFAIEYASDSQTQLVDMSSSTNMEFEEQFRRNRAEDDIAKLPRDRRPAARTVDIEEQRKWKERLTLLVSLASTQKNQGKSQTVPQQVTGTTPPQVHHDPFIMIRSSMQTYSIRMITREAASCMTSRKHLPALQAKGCGLLAPLVEGCIYWLVSG